MKEQHTRLEINASKDGAFIIFNGGKQTVDFSTSKNDAYRAIETAVLDDLISDSDMRRLSMQIYGSELPDEV